MSEALDQLNAELSQCAVEIEKLNERRSGIEKKIKEQRLDEWLKYKNIDTKTFPLNAEMRDFIIKNGFPGGYIEYILDAWSIGVPVTIRGISESEQCIYVAPDGYFDGLFPPDMIVRAVKAAHV